MGYLTRNLFVRQFFVNILQNRLKYLWDDAPLLILYFWSLDCSLCATWHVTNANQESDLRGVQNGRILKCLISIQIVYSIKTILWKPPFDHHVNQSSLVLCGPSFFSQARCHIRWQWHTWSLASKLFCFKLRFLTPLIYRCSHNFLSSAPL